MQISSVCTISTKECITELALFLKCIRWFHPEVPVHILTDKATQNKAKVIQNYLSSGRYAVDTQNMHFTGGLEKYGPISRARMERTPGKVFRTLHEDFMLEKATVLESAVKAHQSALFLDCDIVFLHSLDILQATAIPCENPKWLMLSQHLIKAQDEALFGRFNGGWVGTNDSDVPRRWREYTISSRYFDQAALESFPKEGENRIKIHHASPQSNFGYWRLLQAENPSEILSEFRISNAIKNGNDREILYDEKPLQSIHSHLCMPQLCGGGANVFNGIIRKLCGLCGERYGFLLDALENPLQVD